jgi:cell division GTPase FtsZ
MSETVNKHKYLDFSGLEKYDKLIKSYIALSNKSLVDDVDKLKEDVVDLKSADNALEETLKEYVEVAVTSATNDDIDDLFK